MAATGGQSLLQRSRAPGQGQATDGYHTWQTLGCGGLSGIF